MRRLRFVTGRFSVVRLQVLVGYVSVLFLDYARHLISICTFATQQMSSSVAKLDISGQPAHCVVHASVAHVRKTILSKGPVFVGVAS